MHVGGMVSECCGIMDISPVLYGSKYFAGHRQPRETEAFSQPHPTFCCAFFAPIHALETSILNIDQVRGEEFSLLRQATHVVCDSTRTLSTLQPQCQASPPFSQRTTPLPILTCTLL